MSEPTPAPQALYDLQAAMAALVASGLSADVALAGSTNTNGTSTPFVGSGVFTLSPATHGTFNRTPALLQTESITGTVTVGAQSAPYASSVIHAYDTAGVRLLGQSQATEFDVAQSPILFPITPAFDATPLGTLSRYSDETLSVVLGTTDVFVSTLATAGTRFVPTDEQLIELIYKTYDNNHALIQTDTISFGLSKAGTLRFYGEASQNAARTVTASIPLE